LPGGLWASKFWSYSHLGGTRSPKHFFATIQVCSVAQQLCWGTLHKLTDVLQGGSSVSHTWLSEVEPSWWNWNRRRWIRSSAKL